MNFTPKVSVIIPVFNRENLIRRSIQSVLNQTYKNLELLIIDDASTDNTSEKIAQIKDDRLKYFRNERNCGPSKSRNRGIQLSSGELIAFQDSDDEWYTDKLEKQVGALKECTEDFAAVYCGMEFFDLNSGKKIGDDIREFDFTQNFLTGQHLLTPANVTVLIKKSVLDEVGAFDERLYAAEDTELAMRVSKNHKYKFVSEPLVKVNRNHNQLTGNAKNYTLAKEIIYEKHRNYLSRQILFELCKQIANYYIIKNDYTKAKIYLKECFNHKLNVITLLQYVSLNVFPVLLKVAYSKKYKRGMPHPTKEGIFVSNDT